MKRVVSEKEKQMENMRIRMLTLEADCQKFKDTINRLMDNTGLVLFIVVPTISIRLLLIISYLTEYSSIIPG